MTPKPSATPSPKRSPKRAPEPLDARRTLAFLRALRAHNTRPWFAEHRATYDDHVRPEWQDLVAMLLAAATAFDERFAYVDPRSCIFRLARDIRFATDKTPFKSAVSAWLSPFGKHGSNPGFYVSIGPGTSLVACGIWDPGKPELAALRQHVVDRGPGELDRILRTRALAPYLPLETDPLRVTPRGIPKDHPRPELVRARRFMLRRAIPDAELVRAGPFATFRSAMRAAAPFVAHLERITTTATSEPRDSGERGVR